MNLSPVDRLAIHELLNLHGHLMDEGAFDRLGELFTADVLYDVTAFNAGRLHGTQAIGDAAMALGARNPLAHHVTNIVITTDEHGRVRARSKGFGVYADGTVGSVVYDDIIVREPVGWRIAYRKVSPRS